MNKVIYAERWVDTHLKSAIAWHYKKATLAIFLLTFTGLAFGQYCLPTYQTASCTSGDYINGVQFNTINNQNTGCPGLTSNYIDFTGSICTSVCPGSSYTITISNNATNGEYMAVCIDLTGSGSFSAPGDFFPVGYAAPGANISATIVIPQNASAGNSRLRVFCQGGNTALTQSDICGNLQTGDVQDYCLTINPAVTVFLGSNISQCGGNVTLNAGNTGSTYQWSDGSSNQTLMVSTSGTYSTTVTNGNACSASSSVNVYIKPVPVVSLGPDITQCGGPVTLNAQNAGQNFLWSDGETTQIIEADSSGNYSVEVTEVSSGCTATDSIQVTIDSIPVVVLNTVAPQCGGVDTLDAGEAEVGYLWSNGSTSETLIVSASGFYRVTVTDSSGCSATASENVTIHPLPNVTLNIQPNVCNTLADFSLYGGSPAGGTYYVDYSPDTSINTIDAEILQHHITYTYTDTNGCTDSADADIIVRKHPFITTLDPPVTCTTTTPMNLDDYFTPAGGVYTGLGVGTHFFYPSLSGPGNDTIIDIVTDNYGCTDTSIYPITISQSVSVELVPSDSDYSICAGQTVLYKAYGAQQYQFFINGIAQGGVSSTSTFSTFSLQNGDVVTVVGSNACSVDTAASVGIEVHPLPVVSAGNDTSIALGQSVQLNGTATGSGLFVYQWNPASLLNIGNIPDPVYSGQADSVVFTFIASDTYGCIDSSHVTVHVYVPDAIVLPNVITPDGNGKNDTWKINTRVDLSGSKLVIINRWGETVYEADNYNNDWGGTYRNTGELLPDGTYYYELQVPAENNHVYKGAINILNSSAK